MQHPWISAKKIKSTSILPLYPLTPPYVHSFDKSHLGSHIAAQ